MEPYWILGEPEELNTASFADDFLATLHGQFDVDSTVTNSTAGILDSAIQTGHMRGTALHQPGHCQTVLDSLIITFTSAVMV